MDPMLLSFIQEARENLETAGRCLLALETTPNDPTSLDEMFRAVHTLKGSSGLFDVRPLTQTVHAAEDCLDAVRDGSLELTAELTDDLLEAMDQVSWWIDALENTEHLDSDAAEIGQRLSTQLRGYLGESEDLVATIKPTSSPTQGVPEWAGEVPEAVLANHPARWAVTFTPTADCFFRGEDPYFQVRSTPGLLWCTAKTVEPWAALDTLDPFHCNLRFHLVCQGDWESLQDYYRYHLDQIEVVQWVDAPAVLSTAVARQVLETQAELMAMAGDTSGRQLPAVAGLVERSAALAGHPELIEVAQDARISGQSDALVQALAHFAKGDIEVVDASTAAPEPKAMPEPVKAARSEAAKTLKVDQHRIDALMDLVGELIVAKNALPYLAKKAENEFGSRALAKEIQAQYNVINRLSESLQSAMMQVRMVPMSTVFGRFPRLVRDLSRKLGKQIELVQEGEDIEADKNVVESLADPLIHLVRNSLDHGLEDAATRVAAGKPAQGTLTLRAVGLEDQVRLEVVDDGRGIDPQKIKQLAYQRGLINEARLDDISDNDALQLIFAPGFSTAEQISDLSGRGVGMDVVRSVVAESGGEVWVESEVGQGSRVCLTLPLSLAVNRVMMVEVNQQVYGLPMEWVVETVRLPQAEVRQIKNQRVAVLRDRILPLHSLRGLLGMPEPDIDPSELSILVVQVGADWLGLVIDEFHEGIDVVQKPLEGVLANYPCYSGAALLGNGQVLLILNLRELLA